jgi:hypothetical protein
MMLVLRLLYAVHDEARYGRKRPGVQGVLSRHRAARGTFASGTSLANWRVSLAQKQDVV